MERIEKTVTMKHQRINTAKLRQVLLKKHNHTCVSCGITDDLIPLQIASIIPISEGAEFSEDNFILLCPNCHFALIDSQENMSSLAFYQN